MPATLGVDDLAALARGFSLLGSGGGGRTAILESVVRRTVSWPVALHESEGLDPSTPCVAVGIAGSTYLLAERLPRVGAFERLLATAHRWTGTAPGAVCAIEGAGLNGLTPLLLTGGLRFVDADFMGRALPGLDQMSLIVDAVPGVVCAASTGDQGITLVESPVRGDVEQIVRSALVQAGGANEVLVAGFTVGDLREHAIGGTVSRALSLGRAFEATGPGAASRLAHDLGVSLLGVGRVVDVAERSATSASSIEVAGDDGAILRLVAGSEFVMLLRDGAVIAEVPDIIVAVDSISRDILEVDALTPPRHVTLLGIPAPTWWREREARLRAVDTRAFGLTEPRRA